MNPIQSPRGTRDLLPEEFIFWQYIQTIAVQIAEQMGFLPIRTPLYENSTLFERSIGTGTDVIDKELFMVKGKHAEEEAYALRPEGTAGIVRSFIEHGMHTRPQPVKLYSLVNCFRYERPQKGRYREHWQFDMEYFGDLSPFADAWIILTNWLFFAELGMSSIKLKINSLGMPSERQEYITALKKYLEPVQDQLSEDSQRRLSINPLRILDSKDSADKELLVKAPRLHDYFGSESVSHFEEVKRYLLAWSIPFEEDPYLVRGLDYYAHTTFEWISTREGANTVSLGGGGRYDGLLTQLGGPHVGAVGVGLGLDRIIDEYRAQGNVQPAESAPLIFIAAADAIGKDAAIPLIMRLAAEGVRLDAALHKESLGNQLKTASRLGARYVIILGSHEVETGCVQVKDLENGTQLIIPTNEISSFLRETE